MKVKEIMTAYVTSCDSNATLVAAAGGMLGYNCGTLPVIGGGGKVIGMITERDICLAVSKKGHDVSRIKEGVLSIDDILLQARKAKGKKSRKLSYKDAARTFQAICKPRQLKLARSSRGKKAARQEIVN